MGSSGARSKPSALWFVLGAVLLVGSVALGIGTIVSTVVRALDRVDEFERIPFPAGGVVTLDDAGSYTIYYEGPGVATGDEPSSVPSMRVAVQQVSDGSAVPLQRYRGSFDYHISGRDGAAVFTFRAPAPGRYRILVDADVALGQAELAVGGSLAKGLVGGALIAGMACFLMFTGGVVLIVVTAIRRYQPGRPKPPMPAWTPPPPPYPPPPQPPPQ